MASYKEKNMKLKSIVTYFLICTFTILLSAPSIFAGNNIKQRMKQRLPVIKELKTKGIIGENNQGFLSFIGSKKEGADVVAAENKDRKAVYEAISRKQNTSAVVVGKSRANQIVNKALHGQWLQDITGKWYKK